MVRSSVAKPRTLPVWRILVCNTPQSTLPRLNQRSMAWPCSWAKEVAPTSDTSSALAATTEPCRSVTNKPMGERSMASLNQPCASGWASDNAPALGSRRIKNCAPPSWRKTDTDKALSCDVPMNRARPISARPVAWAMRSKACSASRCWLSKHSLISRPTKRLPASLTQAWAAGLASITRCEATSTTSTGSPEVSNKIR